jgi:hypothetical protein
MAKGAPIRHHRRVKYRRSPYLPSIMLAKKPEIRKNSGMRNECSHSSIGALGLSPNMPPNPMPNPPFMNEIGR